MPNYQEKGRFVGLFEGLSCTNYLIVVDNFQNLRMHIKEKSIPTCWAGMWKIFISSWWNPCKVKRDLT